jgi:hypothetical protein
MLLDHLRVLGNGDFERGDGGGFDVCVWQFYSLEK